MKNKQPAQLSAIRQLIIDHFDESELRTLCFDLGIDYESLPGRGKAEKARELIAYCLRTNELEDLLQACEKARPKVAWPQITDNELYHSPDQPTAQKRTFKIGMGLLIIFIGGALLIFIARSLLVPQDDEPGFDQVLPPLTTNCFDTYFEDIKQEYQATVAVGETAHNFYFSDWGDRENPSLLGLRLMEAGEPIAAVRFLFLPGSTRGNTTFEVVGVVDGNCQAVGEYANSSLLIKESGHLNLELPENAITISFNWRENPLRFGVRHIGEP